jgi:hypothetical protein
MNNRVRALESLIAIFLVGLIIGVGGALLWVDRGPQDATDAGSRSSGGYRKNSVKLSDLLHLTPEQDARIKAIFDDTRRQSAALSKEMGPKFEAIRTEANNKIAAILNDDQKKIWEQFLKQKNESRDRSGRGSGRNDDQRDGGGPQGSQPPRLGDPQPGPDPSGPQQAQPPGFGGPQQQPRGNVGPMPGRGPTGSQLPPPAGASGEKKSQATS